MRRGVHIHGVYCLMGFPDDAHRFHIANTRFKGAYAFTCQHAVQVRVGWSGPGGLEHEKWIWYSKTRWILKKRSFGVDETSACVTITAYLYANTRFNSDQGSHGFLVTASWDPMGFSDDPLASVCLVFLRTQLCKRRIVLFSLRSKIMIGVGLFTRSSKSEVRCSPQSRRQ